MDREPLTNTKIVQAREFIKINRQEKINRKTTQKPDKHLYQISNQRASDNIPWDEEKGCFQRLSGAQRGTSEDDWGDCSETSGQKFYLKYLVERIFLYKYI